MPSEASSVNAAAGPIIALVAGEKSGDQLGGALMAALRERYPDVRFAGIGGSNMKAHGLEAWWDSDELAVMGLAEVLSHLPRLFGLRKKLRKRLLELKPDIFIGIDAPDFNLGLEKSIRAAGITTVHYVSPTVWAWRKGRIKTVGAAADMVMCMFPFEPDLYRSIDVQARYIGHPIADEIPDHSDKENARSALGLDPLRPCIALLPGSRNTEIEKLALHLLGAAKILAQRDPGLQFVAPMAGQGVRALFESTLDKYGDVDCKAVDGQARTAIASADLVICASGTATMETMLINRPMVVVYRFSPLTYAIARGLRLVKSKFIAMPNILAGEELVPELEQNEVNARQIAAKAMALLDDPGRRAEIQQKFSALHATLRKDASHSAANCIQSLLES